MIFRAIVAPLLCCVITATALAAQATPEAEPRPISPEGVLRVSVMVDSVFIDRKLPRATVDAGDFAAYLMARLGARNLPPDFAFTVSLDSSLIRIGGTIGQLPREARESLSQLLLLLPQNARLEAQVEVARAGREAIRFHLRTAVVQGVPIPEAFLAPVMANVGQRYPALTASGRDLYVQVPAGATISLTPAGVELIGP